MPARPGHVYADSMAFGMGMCCLQVTFQLPSILDAMALYDRFIPLAPLFVCAVELICDSRVALTHGRHADPPRLFGQH
jgi:glutamate--cysteine ligase catalytic subunit